MQTLYIAKLSRKLGLGSFVRLHVSIKLMEQLVLLSKSLKDPALDLNLRKFDYFAIMNSVKSIIIIIKFI